MEEDGSEQERDGASSGDSERDRVSYRSNDEEDNLECGKGGIVSCPVILGLFSVVGRLVDCLRSGAEERLHLIQGRLYVHLSKVKDALEILQRTLRRVHEASSGMTAGFCEQRISAGRNR